MQLKMGQEYIIIDVPKAEVFFFNDFVVFVFRLCVKWFKGFMIGVWLLYRIHVYIFSGQNINLWTLHHVILSFYFYSNNSLIFKD